MKNIFKKAHELTRKMKAEYPEVDYRAQFGLYVSYLFEVEKEEGELKELKGTPKQVAWANDIREKEMEQFYFWKELFQAKAKKDGDINELSQISHYTSLLEGIEDAGKWIRIERQMLNITLLLNPKKREATLEYFNAYGIF